MRKVNLFIVGLLFLILSPIALAADYVIDASHSSVSFKIRHMAISTVNGQFTEFEGSYSWDPTQVENSKVEATIKAKSIDTANKKRDDHLRADDFFDVAQFAEIKFVSNKVEPGVDGAFKLSGELSMHGVTRPVVLDVVYQGSVKDPWGKERTGFVGTTRINRKDFGLNWSKLLETGGLVVADEVDIILDIQGTKAESE